MQPLARTLIQQRYVEQGTTTQIVVLPLPESGLPSSLVEGGQPVTLDLLAGRPVNLVLDDEGVTAHLCFAGPPVQCTFPWSAIAAVQSPEGSLVETLAVTIAMVMDDGSMSLAAPLPVSAAQAQDQEEAQKKKEPPRLRIVGPDDAERS